MTDPPRSRLNSTIDRLAALVLARVSQISWRLRVQYAAHGKLSSRHGRHDPRYTDLRTVFGQLANDVALPRGSPTRRIGRGTHSRSPGLGPSNGSVPVDALVDRCPGLGVRFTSREGTGEWTRQRQTCRYAMG